MEKLKLLKKSEAARVLNVSPSTVERMIRRGDLPIVQFGDCVRIDPEELQKKIDSWKTSKV